MKENNCPYKEYCAKILRDTGKNATCYHPIYFYDVLEDKCEFLVREKKAPRAQSAEELVEEVRAEGERDFTEVLEPKEGEKFTDSINRDTEIPDGEG